MNLLKSVSNFLMPLAFGLSLMASVTVSAADIKIAVLAPEGTNWAINLQKLSKDIKEATQGQVNFKMYFGGVAGDEPDVLRKIRVNQLQGGIFTGRTLGDIYGDVRIIELPFNFKKDRSKAWDTVKKFEDYFNKGFITNGFKNLGFFELGNVYVVSTKKANSIEDMKGIKIWSWEGDKLASSLVESLELVSIPLALPDVLTSLTTGVIEAAYANPLGVVALQWQNKVKYLIDFPVTFSLGAFLITQKAWNSIPEKHRAKVEELTSKYVKEANQQTVKENEEALTALKQLGVEFIKFPDKDLSRGDEIRKKVLDKLRGSMISDKAIKLFHEQTNLI